MTVTCGFFNGSDRAANATDVCSIFDGLISDGIYDTIGTAFAVTAAGGNFLNLGPGRAWFNHTWTKNDATVVYEAPAAELLLHRWDRMVLEVDHSDPVRANRIFIMTGTPSSTPSLPSLSAGPLKFQYSLAKIYRAAGSTSIAQIDITPEQGSVSTPFVNALVEKFDIAAILTQYSDRANELIDDLEAAYLVVQQTGIPLHKNNHFLGGSDPIPPVDIGAMPYDATSTNLLINGGFDIWQRGTSQTSSGYGSDDRWKNNHGGATNKTHSRQAFTIGQTDVPGNPKYYSRTTFVSGGTPSSSCTKQQYIEDVSLWGGKELTLSFYAAADVAKYLSVEVLKYYGSGGSPVEPGLCVHKILIGTTMDKYEVTLFVPSNLGKVIGTGSYLGIIFWFDAGSDYNARAASLGNQSGTFDIANVQLNYDSVALPFVPRSYADELRLCARYFIKMNSVYASAGYVYDGTNLASIPLVSPMRIDSPTITLDAYFISNGVSQHCTSGSIYGATGAILSIAQAGSTFATTFPATLQIFSLTVDAEL